MPSPSEPAQTEVTSVRDTYMVERRQYLRYHSIDIDVSLQKRGLLSFLAFQTIPAKLVDVSAGGALIAASANLAANKKILITLRFTGASNHHEFKIPAKIVRRVEGTIYVFYGIQFNQTNEDLIDKLLAKQIIAGIKK